MKSLDQLLQELAREPVRPVPANFEASVWREIRKRRDQCSSWVEELAALIWTRTFASASIATCAIIGAVVSWFSPMAVLDRPASTASSLEVFAAYPPAMPATILTDKS